MERNINFHGELMMKRFNAAVERFEKIIIRIDSRIEKIQAEGKVTTEAEKFEADAKVSIESAKVSIAKIPDVLVEALAQEKLGGSFEDLRTLAASIRADLLSAQKSLLNAVASLKKLSAEAEIESTTSVDTSVQ